MVDAKERTVVTLKDLSEQLRAAIGPPVTMILVYGTGMSWVAIHNWKVTENVFTATTVLGGQIAFLAERPWTVFPVSLLDIRPLAEFQKEVKRDKEMMSEMMEEVIKEGDHFAVPETPVEIPVKIGQYL